MWPDRVESFSLGGVRWCFDIISLKGEYLAGGDSSTDDAVTMTSLSSNVSFTGEAGQDR